MSDAPLTLGTAGHIDHGKTALIHALTGVDCDRLPEERARGITIELGFAPLRLPDGRRLSVIDVPGHERLVRVMVSGATGIDLFLLVIAADDGVMPQTVEHVRVLRALGITHGVVAVTRADLADPARALGQAAELLPDVARVACSARTGEGVEAVRAALGEVAGRLPGRAGAVPAGAVPAGAVPAGAVPAGAVPAGVTQAEARPEGPPPAGATLHVDRVFSIRGAGTVVTGTLWRGTIAVGQRLTLLPAGRSFRVRGVQVHETAVRVAAAGQRVAVNLAGADRRAVSRGDALVGEGADVAVTYRVEVELTHGLAPDDRERVQVHHGTRDVPAGARRLATGRWQLRLERPLLAADGDRFVLRRISPPDTLGGGQIVTARAGGRPPAAGAPPRPPAPQPAAAPLSAGALALEQRLRAAGLQPPTEAELGDDARHLPALRAAGRAVRVGRSMYAHPDAIAALETTARRIIEREQTLTLARLRDELDSSRRYAQALLEHLDAARVTRRLPDDRRVLRGR